MKPRWLIFGIGNPSRGDDALGPMFVAALDGFEGAVDLVLLEDFQWQIEHALDLKGVEAALFVDASLTAAPPFEITPLRPQADAACTTHALSPAALLAVAQRLGQSLPPAALLALPGETFDLGAPLSAQGRAGLEAALAVVREAAAVGEFEMIAGGAVIVLPGPFALE